MTLILEPGGGFLYMKVGTHARETLEDIIRRKTREIEEAGFALWGYGGNTCHPLSMVQPFAKDYEERGSTIYLCMQPMESKHFAEPIRARQYSVDGSSWTEIPPAISVVGSRYALAIRDLRQDEFDLDLAKTKVAIGNSAGRVGSRYIRGRVDKACLEVTEEGVANSEDDTNVRIGLVAELVEPYSVFVRD